MQKPQKSAAKTKAKGGAGFGFVMERRVIQAQPAKRFTQLFEIIRIHRVKPAPHHGDGGFEAGQSLGGRVAIIGDGIANIGVGHGFDRGRQIAHFTRAEAVHRLQLWVEDAHLFNGMDRTG